jgi:alkanesulfonate monooxygenase SsuD/methylene tetrahydromethanopterin reductase-like flavin-dependent oxidoreductase (luciferase family)
VQILRKILAREEPVVHEGFHYQIPRLGEGTTGLGQPLRCMLQASPQLRIYTASVGPKGLCCAGEVADGVLPTMVKPESFHELQLPHLEEGFARAGGGKGLDDFDVCPSATVTISDDLEKARLPLKMRIAFYVGGGGGWGPQSKKNLFNDRMKRLGYEEAALRVQALYRAEKRMEAAAAVPDALIDDVDLVGPAERIRERLAAWREAGRKRYVDTLLVETNQPEALELLAEELL